MPPRAPFIGVTSHAPRPPLTRANSNAPATVLPLLRPPVTPHFLATSLAGVATQGPVYLDAVAIPRHVLTVSRLSEHPDWRGIPRHFL